MPTSGTDLAEAWAAGAGALGTVGAFVVGGVLLIRQISRDDRTDAAAVARARRHQAAQVAAWAADVDNHDPRLNDDLATYRGRPPGKMRAAIVRNASTLPVYDGTLTFVDNATGLELKTAGFEVLGPGDELAFSARSAVDPKEHPTLAAAVRFRDAEGIRWERDHRGVLTESP